MFKPITVCRICGNADLELVIDLGIQALTGVFPRTKSEKVPAGPLELLRCVGHGCGLVQLRHSCEPGLMYGPGYGYRSGLNASMVTHLNGAARHITEIARLAAGDLVLDIGSNDGTLLRAFSAPGVTIAGMDPSADKFSQYYPEEAIRITDFFSADRFRRAFGTRKAKVVSSVAMFYDLESPVQFAREVVDILDDDGFWMFEQSYLPAMVENDSYDTICHEHVEYYALAQIQFIAERVGLRIVDVRFNDANGGSFRVVATPTGGHAGSAPVVEEILQCEAAAGYGEPDVYSRFRGRIYGRKSELKSFLRDTKDSGQLVCGYGASTKGNVILQYSEITALELPFIADVNPDKFGCFTPGTLIPIIAEEDARAMKPGMFLVLPWHFREFIVEKEQAFMRGGGRLVFPLPHLDVVGCAGSKGNEKI
jgi:NDP-4-keto-2,6-dideoxyhexose 3-C-methyltransferase